MTHFETEFDRYYAEALSVLDRSGSIAEVYSYVSEIDDEDYRDRTLNRLASLFTQREQLDEALRFSASISRPLERVHALLDIARLLQKNRSSDSAKSVLGQAAEIAKAISRTYEQATVLLEIGAILGTLASKSEGLVFVHRAVELATPLPQDFEASKTIRACARTLASWNLVSEAIAVAEMIDIRWPGLRREAIDEVQGRGQWPVDASGKA